MDQLEQLLPGRVCSTETARSAVLYTLNRPFAGALNAVRNTKFPCPMVVSLSRSMLVQLEGVPVVHAPYTTPEVEAWLTPVPQTLPTLSMQTRAQPCATKDIDPGRLLVSPPNQAFSAVTGDMGVLVTRAIHNLVAKAAGDVVEGTTMELEVRVGILSTAQPFQTGYRHTHKAVIKNVLRSLHLAVDTHPSAWEHIGRSVYMHHTYNGGLRVTTVRGGDTVLTRKQMMDRVDVQCGNRQYDLRFALASETVVRQQLAPTSVPQHMQLVERESFRERVGAVGRPSIVFRYDISKVSRNLGQTPYICDYHCEVELETRLSRENAHEHVLSYVASLLLARGATLLGTHEAGVPGCGPTPLAHPSLRLSHARHRP
jgi:hypothetical protein